MARMLQPAARTDVGRRPNNEDAVFAMRRLAAVADGVGVAAAGEVASRTIIDALIQLEKCRLSGRLESALAETVVWGNDRIGFVAECRPQLAGMSTTLTAVALTDDDAYASCSASLHCCRSTALTESSAGSRSAGHGRGCPRSTR